MGAHSVKGKVVDGQPVRESYDGEKLPESRILQTSGSILRKMRSVMSRAFHLADHWYSEDSQRAVSSSIKQVWDGRYGLSHAGMSRLRYVWYVGPWKKEMEPDFFGARKGLHTGRRDW